MMIMAILCSISPSSRPSVGQLVSELRQMATTQVGFFILLSGYHLLTICPGGYHLDHHHHDYHHTPLQRLVEESQRKEQLANTTLSVRRAALKRLSEVLLFFLLLLLLLLLLSLLFVLQTL